MLRIIKKIIKGMLLFIIWLFVQIFRWPFYESRFLKGRWFLHLSSSGWRWAFVDICHRLLLQKNPGVPWPVSPYCNVTQNIEFHVDDLNNFNGIGSYFQTYDGKIVIGRGTYIAQNVGIITSNHDLKNLDRHQPGRNVVIGEQCWIGMNALVLPGVCLGPHTVVGAGAVVTKSFPEGNCILAGNPARVIRKL